MNEQVLAFTSLFATHLIDPVYDDCSMKAGPYIAGGQGGQLPPPGKLNVFFFLT